MLALAPNAPEQIIVGREREYLGWFYGQVASSEAAVADAVDEYLRTFRGEDGVLGALGVYRAVFETARQTEALAGPGVAVPVVGVGGSLSRGPAVARWLAQLCRDVEPVVIDGGHFLPEERPTEIAELVLQHIHER